MSFDLIEARELLDRGIGLLMQFEKELRELASELTEKSLRKRYTRFVLRREDYERISRLAEDLSRIRRELEDLERDAPDELEPLLSAARFIALRAQQVLGTLFRYYARFGEEPVQLTAIDEDLATAYVAGAVRAALARRNVEYEDLVEKAGSVRIKPGHDVYEIVFALRQLASVVREAMRRLRR